MILEWKPVSTLRRHHHIECLGKLRQKQVGRQKGEPMWNKAGVQEGQQQAPCSQVPGWGEASLVLEDDKDPVEYDFRLSPNVHPNHGDSVLK